MQSESRPPETRKRKAPHSAFKKGQSGNPGGRTSQQIAAERDKKAFCRSYADELLPDGRTSLRAVMDSIRSEAIGGSAPHAKLFLAYTVGEPDQNVNVSGSKVIVSFPPLASADDPDRS